tara:strand:+ start:979 stop:2109 length:1131 start_codon:yes stop_codon:yes gene_type:complete
MTDNIWYPKEKPLQGITGFGGGATGLRMAGGAQKTDAVWFKNAESNSTAAAIKTLELYNSSVTETAWEVPAGVTSISVAVMGGGAGGVNISSPSSQAAWAVGGGEMVWRNNITVTPGQTLYVKSGTTANLGSNFTGMSGLWYRYISNGSTGAMDYDWSDSAVTNYSRAGYIRTWSGGANKWLVFAEGGKGGNNGDSGGGDDNASRMQSNGALYGSLGSQGTDWDVNRGGNGAGQPGGGYTTNPRGAGGAAGWSGNGGNGGNGADGQDGQGGGGGGGAPVNSRNNFTWGRGGSTFMWGEGSSGAGGVADNGSGGQGSKTGGNTNNPPNGLGEGGDGYRDGWVHVNASAPTYEGWARIAWSTDGTTRAFPSTNVGYPG